VAVEAIVTALIARMMAPVGQALMVLGAAIAAFVWARQSGKNAARSEANAETLKNVETRNAVERDVAREPDPVDRLRGRWTRD
jgi:predicted anti-sigma-YlaC factor YlaD